MAIRGWVYIITNKAMPGIVKIGYSTKDPELRAAELANTGSPHNYFVEYDILVNDPRSVEQKIHKSLASKREGKEWFRCEVDEAILEIRRLLKKSIILEKTNRKRTFKCSIEGCCEKLGIRNAEDGQPYCQLHYIEFEHRKFLLKEKSENSICNEKVITKDHEEWLEKRSLIEKINQIGKSKEGINRLQSHEDITQRKILYVEDEETLVTYVGNAIRSNFPDLQVETAYDGEEALKKIREHTPDFLITGIKMPKMGGLELLEILHNDNKDIPTIIVSGCLSVDVLKTIYNMQLSRQTEIIAIEKPFEFDDLIRVIKELISQEVV